MWDQLCLASRELAFSPPFSGVVFALPRFAFGGAACLLQSRHSHRAALPLPLVPEPLDVLRGKEVKPANREGGREQPHKSPKLSIALTRQGKSARPVHPPEDNLPVPGPITDT